MGQFLEADENPQIYDHGHNKLITFGFLVLSLFLLLVQLDFARDTGQGLDKL